MAVPAHGEYPTLQQKLGDDGVLDLHYMIDSRGREWKNDVLETATDRFERRLTQEGSLIRQEVTATRISILRWMFAFWIANLTATLTVVAMILHAAKLP